MNHQEQAVVKGLRDGENWAYKRLYDDHYVMLCKVAFAYLKDDFLSQTIVEDLMIHIYEKRDTIIITTSLSSYLVRSVRNRCVNYLQSKHEKTVVNFSDTNVPDDWLLSISDPNDDPLATVLENELEQSIRQAIEQLPDECRKVFVKSRFEDKKYETIAAEMNISVNTVKYHIKNALSQLRKDFDSYL